MVHLRHIWDKMEKLSITEADVKGGGYMGTKTKKCQENLITTMFWYRHYCLTVSCLLLSRYGRVRASPVFSKETFAGIQLVLASPKFRLTKDEIDRIIQKEVLPYFDVVAGKQQVFFVCKDPHDELPAPWLLTQTLLLLVIRLFMS